MGQYYNAVIEINDKKDVYYEASKLMENSYWANPFVLAIASKLWRQKGRLAWVGDYADEEDFNWNNEFSDVWEDEVIREDLIYNGFRLEGKLFINYTKKEFIDLDIYKKEMDKRNIDMIINPVSLITAVGNGKGGGDFHSGQGLDMIGRWAWDEISITDEEIYDYHYNFITQKYDTCLKPKFKGFKDITKDALFIEN